MEASSAVMALPERPAMITAVSMGPTSRTKEIPMKVARWMDSP